MKDGGRDTPLWERWCNIGATMAAPNHPHAVELREMADVLPASDNHSHSSHE